MHTAAISLAHVVQPYLVWWQYSFARCLVEIFGVNVGALSRHPAEPGSLYGTSVFWDEYAAGKVGPAASPGGVFC